MNPLNPASPMNLTLAASEVKPEHHILDVGPAHARGRR